MNDSIQQAYENQLSGSNSSEYLSETFLAFTRLLSLGPSLHEFRDQKS